MEQKISLPEKITPHKKTPPVNGKTLFSLRVAVKPLTTDYFKTHQNKNKLPKLLRNSEAIFSA